MRFANKWGRTFYRLRYRIGEYFLKGFVVVFPWLPPSLLAAFTRLAAQLSFFLLWKYRQRMEKNLSLVMGDEFPRIRERRALVRSAWRNFAQGIFETACSLYTSNEAICSTVAIRGEEHLKRSLARGKGVIGLSAHLGNFTMIGPRLAAARTSSEHPTLDPHIPHRLRYGAGASQTSERLRVSERSQQCCSRQKAKDHRARYHCGIPPQNERLYRTL